MKTFVHKDLLRCVNFGGNQEASARWFARIDRETKAVEFLMEQGFEMHAAWLLVKGWVN